LVFSFAGYTTQEVALGASNVLDVKLSSGIGLDEVVVVGYGTQQKRNITGTVSSIKGEDISSLPVQSFDQALQGRAVGVNVSLPNGVLNNAPVFRIRGVNSINLSSYPLIVIDGVPTFTGDQTQNSAANNPLSNLNPNDIESMEILKDASATAIYGSRASAGVVLITTKRGKKGKTKINYDVSTSWTTAARVQKVLNADEFVMIKNEARRNAGEADAFFLDTINGQKVDTKWADLIYQTGFSHNHSLNLSGGNDNTNYYISLGHTQQEGMIRTNTFSRSSARISFDHKISNRVKTGGVIGYSQNGNRAPNTGSLPGQGFNSGGLARIAFNLAPNVAAYNADGSYNINSANQTGQGKNTVGVQWQNPVALIDLNNFTSNSNQIQANIFAQVDIVKGLYFKTLYGLDNLAVENKTYQSSIHGDGFTQGGFAFNGSIKNNRWNWQNFLNYDVNLDSKNNINVLLGNEQQYTSLDGWGASRSAQTDPYFQTYQGTYSVINPAGNFQSENYLLSYFGRLNYAYDKLFSTTLNVRQDEYSAFATGQKRGIFWGGSLGLTISELDFWKNNSLLKDINYFKLRGSYGTVGNNQGINDFASYGLYNSGLYGTTGTISLNQIARPNLSWETSTKTDIGAVFGILNDRFTGEITYFVNEINGLITSVPQAPSKGIPDNGLLTNVGSMTSKGWEFGVNGTILKNKNFKWTSNINLTLIKNNVDELYNNTDIFGITSSLEQTNVTRVGQSVGSLFVVPTAGVNPANGRRIFVNSAGRQVQYLHLGGTNAWTYVDDNSVAPAISIARDGVVMGPTLPTWFGAWNNTFSAYGFDLEIQTQYSGGNYIYNGSKAGMRDMRVWNNHTDVLNRWQKTGDVTDIPRVVWTDNVSNGSAIQISENVEKGDFLRIRNITLAYRLPANILEKMNLGGLRIFANINNAFLFTNYTGTDPEVSANGNINVTPGVDRNTAPMARTFLIGANVTF
jgi:TonB-linked SusC/RagA family outer membrane protein